jgi:hypothetical protein
MSPAFEDEDEEGAEEGEISDKDDDSHFSNTYKGKGGKRSAQDADLDGNSTLAAAQKRMKGLC